jgi:hypothetical protein
MALRHLVPLERFREIEVAYWLKLKAAEALS